MYIVLDKDTIENEIVPYLPLPKRGFPPTVPLVDLVNAILYKLKTGIQWIHIPVTSLFSETIVSWNTVYHHYNKWSKSGVWKTCWMGLQGKYKAKIDLSSGDLDGSQTTALRGGEAVAFQGRKKRKTTNALYLTDRQGLPLAMSEPIAGNHNYLYDISLHFEELTSTLEGANISVDGLFLNADSGFDAKELRALCAKKGIIANFAENRRNKADADYFFNEVLFQKLHSH